MNKFAKLALAFFAVLSSFFFVNLTLAAPPQIQPCSSKALTYFPKTKVETVIGRTTIRTGFISSGSLGSIGSGGDGCSFVFDSLKSEFVLTLYWEEKSSADASQLFWQLTNPIPGDINGIKIEAVKTTLNLGDESVLGTFNKFHDGYDYYTIYARKNNVLLSAAAVASLASRAQLEQIIRYALDQVPNQAGSQIRKIESPNVSAVSNSNQKPLSPWRRNGWLILAVGLSSAAALAFLIWRKLKSSPPAPPPSFPLPPSNPEGNNEPPDLQGPSPSI